MSEHTIRPKADKLLFPCQLLQKASVYSATLFLCTAPMINWLDYHKPILWGYLCIVLSRGPQRHAKFYWSICHKVVFSCRLYDRTR